MRIHRSDTFLPRRAAGAWQLDAGRVVKLCPRENAYLRAGHGSLWVTFDRPLQGALNESGDYFIAAGQKLAVAAGQTVVVSPAGPRGSDASFDWEIARVRRREPGWRESLLRFWSGLGLSAAPAH